MGFGCWEWMGRLTVAILSDLAVFCSVYEEGLVTCGGELLCVGVVDLEGDGFTTEPVACGLVRKGFKGSGKKGRQTDVISIAVKQVHANALVKQIFEVLSEVRENEVTRVLELPVEIQGQLATLATQVGSTHQ
jgi:hypothetical protein